MKAREAIEAVAKHRGDAIASRSEFYTAYTLSENFSDDDNERTATGYGYDNVYNLKAEYGYSSIDIRHNFSSYAVTTLPMGTMPPYSPIGASSVHVAPSNQR